EGMTSGVRLDARRLRGGKNIPQDQPLMNQPVGAKLQGVDLKRADQQVLVPIGCRLSVENEHPCPQRQAAPTPRRVSSEGSAGAPWQGETGDRSCYPKRGWTHRLGVRPRVARASHSAAHAVRALGERADPARSPLAGGA